ncbi:hypothetical protein TrCOL_g1791 [Triparma columacea]|uniref:Uncharacterized protein n=1 Tax=Triparma columacea TaxID=722753 RepID=A0A9W7GR94_9STRA|nr:hypothetical protein TrCOL_g1791 [Triparma columacea]
MNDSYKKSFPPLTTEAELNISASQLSFGDKAQGPFPVEKVVLQYVVKEQSFGGYTWRTYGPVPPPSSAPPSSAPSSSAPSSSAPSSSPKFSLKSSETPAKLNAKQQDAFKLVPPADFRKAAKKDPSKVSVKAPRKVFERAKAAKEHVKAQRRETKGGKKAAPCLETEAFALKSALLAALEEAASKSFQGKLSSRAKLVYKRKRKADEVKREAEEEKRKAVQEKRKALAAASSALLKAKEAASKGSVRARRKARKKAKRAFPSPVSPVSQAEVQRKQEDVVKQAREEIPFGLEGEEGCKGKEEGG